MNSTGTVARDWSRLPEDLLLIAMAAMEVPDVVRSGAVCSSWHAAYGTFRCLRLSTPKQPPCLFYACHGYGADAAALYSPSGNATFRVGFPDLGRHTIHGSAHGWLFITDEAANPHLLNPLTGARAALPPASTFERVKRSFSGNDGGVRYSVDIGFSKGAADICHISARKAMYYLYQQVAISSPAAAACVVLVVHRPCGALSFARTGDERWTTVSVQDPLNHADEDFGFIISAVHNDRDGLFYVMVETGAVHALDLGSPRRLVARSKVLVLPPTTVFWPDPQDIHYLVFTGCSDLLLVTRRRRTTWAEDYSNKARRRVEYSVATTDVWVDKVDVDRQMLVRLTGVGDNVLFLGRNNSPLCLPTSDYPMLSGDSAYLTTDHDDSFDPPIRRQDVGVFDLGSSTMRKLGDVWDALPHGGAPQVKDTRELRERT
uniref:Uncharacterized protein n=1 Tax=Avena sativa TaxID=4498 RepID=A0ACD5UBM5_AVESA